MRICEPTVLRALGHAWDPMGVEAASLGRLFIWGPSSSLGTPSPRGENSPLSWEPGPLLLLDSLPGLSENRAAPDLQGGEDVAEEGKGARGGDGCLGRDMYEGEDRGGKTLQASLLMAQSNRVPCRPVPTGPSPPGAESHLHLPSGPAL